MPGAGNVVTGQVRERNAKLMQFQSCEETIPMILKECMESLLFYNVKPS